MTRKGYVLLETKNSPLALTAGASILGGIAGYKSKWGYTGGSVAALVG